MRKIDYVDGGDWCGVFVDGRLRYEGHSVPTHFMFQLLKELGISVQEHEASEEWLAEEISFPESFDFVVTRKR